MSKLDRLDPDTLKDNPRATFSAWTRYTTIVRRARELFPHTYKFQPLGQVPATVASRLRDAIRGAIAFDYTEDTPELRKWYEKIIITHTQKELIIRARDALRISPEVTAVLDDKFPFSYDTLDQTEYDSFGNLLNSGRIVGPVHMKHAPQFLQRGWMNVEVIQRPDGSTLLL